MNLQRMDAEHTIDVERLPQKPLVLDIGCRGFEFDYGILNIRPDAKIIALDPDPSLEAPQDSRITFMQAALTDLHCDSVCWQGPGEGAYIADRENDPGFGWPKRSDSVQVKNFTLKQLGDYFDLIKLDCEGSEFGILENWPGPVAGQISIEFHDTINRDRWNEAYFKRLFSGPLRDYDVVKFDLSPLGPANSLGHWDSLLLLKTQPRWSILILSQPSRQEFIERLFKRLLPQLENRPDVEILVRVFDPLRTLGENRQALVTAASGEYINFVDDDDLVPEDYVERIYPLLDGTVDYIGFRVEISLDGTTLNPIYHSLRYGRWYSEAHAIYRDISHVNPILRRLALEAKFEGGPGEDHRWADRMRQLGKVRAERYVDAVMYFYLVRSNKKDAQSEAKRIAYAKWLSTRLHTRHRILAEFCVPPVPEIEPSMNENRRACPRCDSRCTINISNMTRCNQCGHQF